MVRKYKVKIEAHRHLIDDIYSLEFSSESKKFKYKPGQFLHLAIDEYDGVGQWPDSRCFSMQTGPSDKNIRITYAAKGKFTKQVAEELKNGDFVWIKLPYGNLFQNFHDIKNSVFIAGGTGITPFLSLFNDNSFSDYLNPQLFLGLRDRKYHLYKKELTKAQEINSDLHIHLYFENENGRPSLEDILKASNLSSDIFISGPPTMINFYKEALVSAGVKENKIITDDWE